MAENSIYAIKAAQRFLHVEDSGLANSPETISAIMLYQKQHGYAQTGQLDGITMGAILADNQQLQRQGGYGGYQGQVPASQIHAPTLPAHPNYPSMLQSQVAQNNYAAPAARPEAQAPQHFAQPTTRGMQEPAGAALNAEQKREMHDVMQNAYAGGYGNANWNVPYTQEGRNKLMALDAAHTRNPTHTQFASAAPMTMNDASSFPRNETAPLGSIPPGMGGAKYASPVRGHPLTMTPTGYFGAGRGPTHTEREHWGTDFQVARNERLYGVANGTVYEVNLNDHDRDGGHSVTYKLDQQENGHDVFITYRHINTVPEGIREGARVTPETVVAFAGDTGNAKTSGAELHFEKAYDDPHTPSAAYRIDASADLPISNPHSGPRLAEGGLYSPSHTPSHHHTRRHDRS